MGRGKKGEDVGGRAERSEKDEALFEFHDGLAEGAEEEGATEGFAGGGEEEEVGIRGKGGRGRGSEGRETLGVEEDGKKDLIDLHDLGEDGVKRRHKNNSLGVRSGRPRIRGRGSLRE